MQRDLQRANEHTNRSCMQTQNMCECVCKMSFATLGAYVNACVCVCVCASLQVWPLNSQSEIQIKKS